MTSVPAPGGWEDGRGAAPAHRPSRRAGQAGSGASASVSTRSRPMMRVEVPAGPAINPSLGRVVLVAVFWLGLAVAVVPWWQDTPAGSGGGGGAAPAEGGGA